MSDEPAEQRRRRASRRAVAAPTNPAADQADEVPSARERGPGAASASSSAGREAGRAPRRLDPRDTWILEQRPPHWD